MIAIIQEFSHIRSQEFSLVTEMYISFFLILSNSLVKLLTIAVDQPDILICAGRVSKNIATYCQPYPASN